jgi:hypothetical protein
MRYAGHHAIDAEVVEFVRDNGVVHEAYKATTRRVDEDGGHAQPSSTIGWRSTTPRTATSDAGTAREI